MRAVARKLSGPDGVYSVLVEAFLTRPHGPALHFQTDEGLPCAGLVSEGGITRPNLIEPAGDCRSFLVRLGPEITFMLDLLDRGMVIQNAGMTGGGRVTVTARVEAGPGAPTGMAPCTTHVLLAGDATDLSDAGCRYLPLAEGEAPGGADGDDRTVGVDRLAWALGRSLARANADLAARQGAGGVALVAGVTVRVGVAGFRVTGRDQVMVTLPEGGQAADQFIELNLKTVPACDGEDA